MLEDGQAKHQRSKLDGCKPVGPEDAGDVAVRPLSHIWKVMATRKGP